MEKSACGIVSYAGLAWETLLSRAKVLFAQSKLPVPRRFDSFLPLFPLELIQNMDYLGLPDARNPRVGPSGFSIDPTEYHRKLYAQLPSLYAEDNYLRNFDYEGRYTGQGAFTVDRAWADRFPQYAPFLGERLAIYLIGGGFQAVAVPESVYPRGGGVLAAAEAALEITQHVELFNQYARARVATGDPYDAERFQTEFLHATGLTVTTVTQAQIERALQDLSIIKSLHNEDAGVGLYTENARRAERVFQYVPMRYACDLFAEEAVDKHTARLAQPCEPASDFVSDLWIPYQDLSAYLDRQTMALDMRSLCEGYQIAPRYDPETGGGRYPSAIRVATVRDRALRLLVGEVLNNPAYGDGMSPQGTIGRQAYIADSREMIRQRKLTLEDTELTTQNLTLPPEAYRKRLALAILQEHKGRLVDAMYRRETALGQIDAQSPVYRKACELLNERVERLTQIVRREGAQSGMSQMSGYDADLDYLRRKQLDREGEPEETPGAKRIAFARDPQREQSIESGYAMRSSLIRMLYRHAALPEPPTERTLGADDSEDDLAREPLAAQAQPGPPAPAAAGKPGDSPAAPRADTAASAPEASAEPRERQALPPRAPDDARRAAREGAKPETPSADGLAPSDPHRHANGAGPNTSGINPNLGEHDAADPTGHGEEIITQESGPAGHGEVDNVKESDPAGFHGAGEPPIHENVKASPYRSGDTPVNPERAPGEGFAPGEAEVPPGNSAGYPAGNAQGSSAVRFEPPGHPSATGRAETAVLPTGGGAIPPQRGLDAQPLDSQPLEPFSAHP
ncbi:MAG: hypothetical protein GX418_08860, partial [Clostridiales bacterium]|nr:hypothetical protein [Clostridiales bacterium]